jgi:hypothetical protein
MRDDKTWLGDRRLRIYWATDEGWSKRLRDRSGEFQIGPFVVCPQIK